MTALLTWLRANVLALPGILLVAHLPSSEPAPDFLFVILLPAVFSVVLCVAFGSDSSFDAANTQTI